MEDAQVAAEREEAINRERIRRFRDKEDALRKELVEGRKEVDIAKKAEGAARARVEEIEEALHDSTSALENAQAEVEILRAEVAVSSFPSVQRRGIANVSTELRQLSGQWFRSEPR